MSKKTLGYQAEQLVKNYYTKNGWKCLHENRTIRGGEIDLVMQDANELCFIEVKAVQYADDLHDYVSHHKLRMFSRAIHTYCHRLQIKKDILLRVDVVFVKNNAILHIFDHCSIPAW